MVAGATFCLGGRGGYAEFICLPASELVPVPPGVDPAEAVCMVTNYLTAHMALHRTAHVRSGERILVHGAAGGVGTALLQLGKLAGLEMYAQRPGPTTRSCPHSEPRRLTTARRFCRAHPQHHRRWVDAVFDPIGGARQLVRSYRTLRKGGRLVWFGVAATKKEGLRVIPLPC